MKIEGSSSKLRPRLGGESRPYMEDREEYERGRIIALIVIALRIE